MVSSGTNNEINLNPRLSARQVMFLLFLAALSLGAYLLFVRLEFRSGFPLDDAWIHQTYARNLALNGEWSFVSGHISAGSTSPLWSALLAIGYWLHLGPFLWTFALGCLLLAIVAGVSVLTFKLLAPKRAHLAWLAALLLLFEWHLVWAAGSGMETLLYSLIVLIGLSWLLKSSVSWVGLGALVGLSVWVRPDGITLLGPAMMVIVLREGGWRLKLRSGLGLLLGVALLFTPYLVFNQALAGAWWPNTFFAKQAEYAVLRQQSLLVRLLQQAELPLIGVGVILLPGFVYRLGMAVRRREWAVLAGALWFLGYLGLYAWRLPVTYQHGRYVIPAMPVYLLWSFAGAIEWMDLGVDRMLRRIVGRSWAIMIVALLLGFWLLGARSYAMDVGFIESQMVDTAQWITRNTSPNSLIAVHDIGAMGFFAKRDLVDLAGLVSPEVIPFIRDESHLEQYLNQKGVDYLVTFPDWYPHLVQGKVKVYCGPQNKFLVGSEAMCVYSWQPNP